MRLTQRTRDTQAGVPGGFLGGLPNRFRAGPGWWQLRRGGAELLALFTLAILAGGCGQSSEEIVSAAPVLPPAASTAPVVLGEPPGIGVGGGYVGAASCAECHRDQHQSWHASYHRTMTQEAVGSNVAANFEGVVLETGGERFTLSRRGDEHWVAIEDLEELAALPPGAPKPPPVQVRLALTTGSHHMQVFWMPAGFGNAQIGFPFTWLIDDQRWAPRHDLFVRPPGAVPPVETWNLSCIRCHATAGQPRPSEQRDRFDTRVAELGISCEACHGPAGEHDRAMRAWNEARRADPAAAKPTDLHIVNPKSLEPVRSSHVCAQCHSMKWFDAGEGWEQSGFRYRPGDDLEATTPVIRPNHLDQQPAVKAVVQRHPRLLTDFFWPDGMIRVAGREYNGLLESACHQRGKLSCVSCHSMHEYEQAADQMAAGMSGDRACVSCHAADRYAAPSHTHHRAGSEGAACYNCHMPHTSYALLKGVRQHEIDSPRVAATLASGRPNACNLCHLDQSLGWTARHLREWYGQPMPDDPRLSEETSAAVAGLLSGDAGERILYAWHLGWEPARKASGDDWTTALLAGLLEDPYSAVRAVAWRALRTDPPARGVAYDFAGPEASRLAVARELASRLNETAVTEPDAARRRALLLREDGRPDLEARVKWVSRRNDRPVHLRE